MNELQHRKILYSFMCREFGYENSQQMLEQLRDVEPEFSSSSNSNFSHRLYRGPREFTRISKDQLLQYDSNISIHCQKLRLTGEHARELKPFQYLAVLFTEHYLYRYFFDVESLCDDLNEFKKSEKKFKSSTAFEVDDLRTIAIQSATGSGKTLIMHVNILQYQHYLSEAAKPLNNIVLLTPSEQMSSQHKSELQLSGLNARIFSAQSKIDFVRTIEILDVNKLAKKTGVKRVSVQEFGTNNLVVVDEGHLGASGNVWRQLRQELAQSGFMFEYSATFNQVASNAPLRDFYSKCLLYDYPYRQFYKEGYGKDYHISNIRTEIDDSNSKIYLLGSLLAFYQQLCIWHSNQSRWKAFNLTKPLWVFLGKTVIGTGKADNKTRTDVIQILDFLNWVLKDQPQVQENIGKLLAGNSGLLNEDGTDFFLERFNFLQEHAPANNKIYNDICEKLFHGTGVLRIAYLTEGNGELHLQSADNPVFGVVNVGDSATLYKLLTQTDCNVVRESGFVKRLFPEVDSFSSQINIVIGARKFIAGWNSWRVATMGLMHVGVGEGPEIIQMFGRGVRLKGWNMSLKRHTSSGAVVPENSDHLSELEKLYIFGLRSNYMQEFRNYLEKQGIEGDQEEFSLPVSWNIQENVNLKTITIPSNLSFKFSKKRLELPSPQDSDSVQVQLDLRPTIQSVTSEENDESRFGLDAPQILNASLIELLDQMRIYDRLLRIKIQKGWSNMSINSTTVSNLLNSHSWYTLYLPEQLQNPTNMDELLRLENVVLKLITEYADQFWRRNRSRWEQDKIETIKLEKDNPNVIKEYLLSIDSSEKELINGIEELIENVESRRYSNLKINLINASRHAYQPLLYADENSKITIQPAALNQGEKQFVEKFMNSSESDNQFFRQKEIYLLRNLVGNRGISFFEDSNYYPDFIMWVNSRNEQHIIFLDPKGLVHFNHKTRKKVELHKSIKNVEQQLRSKGNHDNVRLHSFVLSITDPKDIGEGLRTKEEWNADGVYFMSDPSCLADIFEKVLEP